MPRVEAAVLAEHRANRCRHALDGRHHHHHIARLQRPAAGRRGLGQQRQQLVVQHLEFAHHAVRAVEHDGTVAARHLGLRMLRQRHHVADRLLHLGQQRRPGVDLLVEDIDARQFGGKAFGQHRLERIELAHIVARLPAPRRQQRVRMRVHHFQRQRGQVAAVLERLAPALHAQQFAAIDRIGPVEAAGVGHGQQDLAVARHCRQRLQHRQRQMAHAEQHHAARDRTRQRRGAFKRGNHLAVQFGTGRRALGVAQAREDAAPQPRLPPLLLGHGQRRLARRGQHIALGGPVLEPVGAIDLVLIEKIGESFGQLKQSLRVSGGQKTRNGFIPALRCAFGQLAHQPPGQCGLVQRRLARHGRRAQHLAVAAPQKARRQFDARRGAHAQRLGHAHLEPLGHAVALHQHHLLLQRRQRMRAQPREHRLGQGFGAVAMQGNQPGLQCRCQRLFLGKGRQQGAAPDDKLNAAGEVVTGMQKALAAKGCKGREFFPRSGRSWFDAAGEAGSPRTEKHGTQVEVTRSP